MKMLWKLTKEASRYKVLYLFAIISTLCLTAVNLAAPKVLSTMTGVVEKGMVEESLKVIIRLTLLLLALYLFRVVSGSSAIIWHIRQPGIWWGISEAGCMTNCRVWIWDFSMTSRPAI